MSLIVTKQISKLLTPRLLQNAFLGAVAYHCAGKAGSKLVYYVFVLVHNHDRIVKLGQFFGKVASETAVCR